MRSTSELTTGKLASMYTNELASQCDVDIESIYARSETATEMLRRGKRCIPDIGKYLYESVETLASFSEEEVKSIEIGWLFLYCDLAFSGDRSALVFDFEKLKEIAKNYVPG